MFFFIVGSAVWGIAVGALFGWIIFNSFKFRKIQRAKGEAETLVLKAQDEAEERMEQAHERADEFEEKLFSAQQKEILQLEKKVDVLEEKYRRARSEADRNYHQVSQSFLKEKAEVTEAEKKIKKRQSDFEEFRRCLQDMHQEWVQKLSRVCGEDPAQLLATQVREFEQSFRVEVKKREQRYEDHIRAHSEEMAKEIINNVLNRFLRPACIERGIGIVELPSADVKAKVVGPQEVHLRTLEKACGVDLQVTEDNTIAISGFDPVRRELATRCLERLLRERKINSKLIEEWVEKAKADLLRKIESDGRLVAKELGCNDLHVEIKKMLGSLRYRYSFTQNQYFHVAEVGWLCGLLAQELGGVDRRDARRSGLLHDIGKAMDHSVEGGHAVIGADFIKKFGEAAHIVHAVRAHHYEEQPASDLAFLVIAADAISGARPGARRQTVNTYNQKIEALSVIGDSFDGVLRTMIFNAGREVRVQVDAKKISDQASLELCREIADKIEAECSYPGQIRVVVVRETAAEAVAK